MVQFYHLLKMGTLKKRIRSTAQSIQIPFSRPVYKAYPSLRVFLIMAPRVFNLSAIESTINK